MATQQQQDRLFDEICNNNQNYEHFDKLFSEVLLEVENDADLETYKREYENLHKVFIQSHDGERRLIKKCMDLSAEIGSCQVKVKHADELSGNDKLTIDQLKKEIVKANGKITQSQETEITLKEKIKQLKVDIKELDKQVQRGAEGVIGHDTTLRELGRCRVDLQKEHDTQKQQLVGLEHDIDHLTGRLSKVRAEKDAQDKSLKSLHESIEAKQNELDEQRARKEKKEKELKALKEDLAKKNKMQQDNQTSIIVANSEIEKVEKTVNQTRDKMEKAKADLKSLSNDIQNARDKLAACMEENQQLQKQAAQLGNQVKVKEGEVNAMRRDCLKQGKLVDAIKKRNIVLDTLRAETEAERNTMRFEIQSKEDEIQRLSKLADNDKKQIEDLTRERDILNKNYLKAQSATQRQKDWLVVKENQRRNLEHQIKGFDRHSVKQQEMVHSLTEETKKYERQAEEACVKYTKTLEEIKAKEVVVSEKQKQIHDDETRLKLQQTLLDTVLNERNLYTKNHQQLTTEIASMKHNLRIMINSITQLKDEIQRKERSLLKKDRALNNWNSDKKDYEIFNDACRKKTERKERTIEAYNKELHKLNQIIADADAEKNRQRRDHVNVMNERDILGAQLIKRNDELAHLYEKIRIQQSALHKGEKQYEDRLRDMQGLNLRVNHLATELGKMRSFANRLPELKLLVNQTQRELTREKCRVRTLLDECDNPMNVHRWTTLKGSEPHTYKKIKAVRDLQRELIEKSNEITVKDKLIAEKEKLYVELRAIIQRQPGPEVAEQLNVYQDTLHKKTAQMKAMKASLKHFQEQVEHFKSQHEEIQGELKGLDDDYIHSRKREKKDDQKRRQLNEMMGRAADAPIEEKEDVYVGYTAPPREHNPDFDGTLDSITPTAGAGGYDSGTGEESGAEGDAAGAHQDHDDDDAGAQGEEGTELPSVVDADAAVSSDAGGQEQPAADDDQEAAGTSAIEEGATTDVTEAVGASATEEEATPAVTESVVDGTPVDGADGATPAEETAPATADETRDVEAADEGAPQE